MLSFYKANQLLTDIIGNKSGSSTYLGLSKTAPNRDGTGVTEPDGSAGYERTLLCMGSQSATNKMNTPSVGEVKNKEVIYFPEATGAWGTCTYYVLYDAKTGGNLIAYGALSTSISPVAGVVPLIRVDELQMTLS